MKNLNSEEQVINMLKKAKDQIEPSREIFNRIMTDISKSQNVTNLSDSRYSINKDRPSIISNLINSMKYNWKFAVPSAAVILIAAFIGYQYIGNQQKNVAKNDSFEKSTKKEIVENMPNSQDSVETILAQMDKDGLYEEQAIDEEGSDLAMLSEDDEYFNELNNVYEK